MRYTLLYIATLLCCGMNAQTAKEVLDKTAALLDNKNGITASYTITDERGHSANGTMAVKGKMFHTAMSTGKIWFDGKTVWSYLAQSEEVNISEPTEAELPTISPYGFIYLYRNGYTQKLTTKGNTYVVNLTSTDRKQQIKEMEITVNKQSYVPTRIRMRSNNSWQTIVVSNFKQAKLNNAMFRFKKTDYPNAEIIDLR